MHDHDHGHGTRRALGWALALNGGFLVIEAGVGLATGSLALLGDAAHMVGDVAALALALGAAVLAERAATADHSFGWGRAEVLGGLVNGLAMLLVVGMIGREAALRLLGGPPEVAAWPVLVVGAVGLAINLGSAWALMRADRGNLNVRGALVHMLGDALGSVGAMLAAVGLWLGFPAADALAGLAVAALVLVGTLRLLADAARILMEFSPEPGLAARVEAELRGLPGVVGVHDLHLWTLDGQERLLTAHVVCAPGVAPGPLRREAARRLAEGYGVRHATLQAESEDCCDGRCCALAHHD